MKKILIGNVVDELKKVKDNSINCIITSPPYYAMRNYGTDPQIWDTGVADNNCDHNWEEIKIRRMNLSGGKTKKTDDKQR